MKRQAKLWGALAVAAAVAAPVSALAQERGRTDGPEGSEYGKGGYQKPSSGRLSLQFDWGAAVLQSEPLRGAPEGPPLFIGATVSYSGSDWYQLDVSGAYLFDGGRLNVMMGPRFRTWGYPLSFFVGLKAGLINIPEVGARFGLSPEAGFDLRMDGASRIILGLGYSPDIPLGVDVDGDAIAHRVFMNVGYRF